MLLDLVTMGPHLISGGNVGSMVEIGRSTNFLPIERVYGISRALKNYKFGIFFFLKIAKHGGDRELKNK